MPLSVRRGRGRPFLPVFPLRDANGVITDDRPHLDARNVLFAHYRERADGTRVDVHVATPYSQHVKIDTGSRLCIVSAFTMARLLDRSESDVHFQLRQLEDARTQVERDAPREGIDRRVWLRAELVRRCPLPPFEIIEITSSVVAGTTYGLALSPCAILLELPGSRIPREVATCPLVTYRGSSTTTPVLGMPFLGHVQLHLDRFREPRGSGHIRL